MANRDTWTVTAVGRRGELLVTASTAAGARRHRDITPVHKSEVLPADYVAEQTELAYASTVYGVQARPSPRPTWCSVIRPAPHPPTSA